MLIGQYESKISAKRRIAIPSKIRKHLGDKLIVARWYEGSLVLTNFKGWEKLMARLTKKSETMTVSVRDTDRFILGGAFELEMDRQGRTVLPLLLTQHAQLKTQALFIGLGDRAEIWDKENWIRKEKEIREYAGYLVEKLAKDHA